MDLIILSFLSSLCLEIFLKINLEIVIDLHAVV